MAKQLPDSVGKLLKKELLPQPHQQEFLRVHRLRYCIACKKVGSIRGDGLFECPACHKVYERFREATGAMRVYHRFALFAGRRGGKTLIGAYATREELLVPDTLVWVCAPSFKWLHDTTMPTMLGVIPPEWIVDFNLEHEEYTLANGSKIQFRSLDDPERGRGQGAHFGWFDEASLMEELAWHVFRPSLTEHRGAMLVTTSPRGYDWVHDNFYAKAMSEKVPGYWATKYRTIDNPFIEAAEVEEARATMPPLLFAQEYEAEFVNYEGAVYGETIEPQILHSDEQIQKLIPEWPAIDPKRECIVGLDSGANHPFGAVLAIQVPGGLVIVDEYLQRLRTFIQHITEIKRMTDKRGLKPRYAANRNEAQLRQEFAFAGLGVIEADATQEKGIQRVQTWLHTRNLYFAYTVPKTIEQMKRLKWADPATELNRGKQKGKERVFKLNDELPDCVRYLCMTFPELPAAPKIVSARDKEIEAYGERTANDIARLADFEKRLEKQGDLGENEEGYPLGEFSQSFGGGW